MIDTLKAVQIGLTSMRCRGRVWCNEIIHSLHFSIPPLAQSLHLITPFAFPHLEHSVLPRKSPSPSCCSTSSRNIARNATHSSSRSWCLFNIHIAWGFWENTYRIFCMSLSFVFSAMVLDLRCQFNLGKRVHIIVICVLKGGFRCSGHRSSGRWIWGGWKEPGMKCSYAATWPLAHGDEQRGIGWRRWLCNIRDWSSKAKSSTSARKFKWGSFRFIGRIGTFRHEVVYWERIGDVLDCRFFRLLIQSQLRLNIGLTLVVKQYSIKKALRSGAKFLYFQYNTIHDFEVI